MRILIGYWLGVIEVVIPGSLANHLAFAVLCQIPLNLYDL